MYGLLDTINSPADIKKLDSAGLVRLCAELRAYIVGCCSRNPGHLASSLGAVELIAGVHYVFDTPEDKLVFDVGHQSYAHKILTGRREAFAKARTKDGISGFPRISESEYDAFGTGHSSTSVSAALGLAEASRMQGLHRKVVAIIGDGALSGGLAFEGLNNGGASNADLLIILNDNDHSIDDNQGAIRQHLLKLTTGRHYNAVKKRVWDMLGEGHARNFVQRGIRSVKSWFVGNTGGDLFEALGFRYFGPVDGNDINEVVSALERLKEMNGPRILHCITTKGKGYAPAEADPTTWHAPGKFDPSTGRRIVPEYIHDRYQDVFGQVLCELADIDTRVVGITPAMASGCGMSTFARKHKERFFDVGIEEEHAVTFSAGLAAGGMRPFCNIYSSFSQRAYDQIIHDVALQNLPVIMCFDRAGLVGEDGATHNGAFDLAAYRSIPNAVVSAPKDETELKLLMYTALNYPGGPFIIRYPRGMGEGADWKETPYRILPVGKAERLLGKSEDCPREQSVAIVCTGPTAYRAMEAASGFHGNVGVYNFRFVKPIDEEALDGIITDYAHILTVEEGALKGGLMSAVCEYVAAQGLKRATAGLHTDVDGIGIPDIFIGHGRQKEQREWCGTDAAGIEKKVKNFLHNQK